VAGFPVTLFCFLGGVNVAGIKSKCVGGHRGAFFIGVFPCFPVFSVLVASWCKGQKNCRHGERGFNALRFPFMCRRFAVAVQSQAQAAFLPGVFNQSSGAQVETYASHRPIDGQFQVGKPAGKFSARQAELGLSPKPARSESELILNCGRQSGGKPARFADTVYDTNTR